MERETHIIDASGKVLGRLASQIAVLLRGKHRPDFMPNKDTGDFVVVKNAGGLILSGKKLDKKKYFRYTGYPGGLKTTFLKDLFEKDPAQVLRKAVFGMLPVNKLRPHQLKRLKFE